MSAESDVLVLVDLQNDFCAGGALAVPGGEEVVPLANALARRFAHLVLTQDWHPPTHSSFASSHAGAKPYDVVEAPYGQQTLWPDHCVQGTAGAAFHPMLETRGAELIIRKGFHQQIDSYSTFFENDRKTPTGLDGYLRERGFRRVCLAGLALDFCVAWSAEDAVRLGFEVIVFEDACRAIDLEGSKSAALGRMRELGVAFASAAAA